MCRPMEWGQGDQSTGLARNAEGGGGGDAADADDAAAAIADAVDLDLGCDVDVDQGARRCCYFFLKVAVCVRAGARGKIDAMIVISSLRLEGGQQREGAVTRRWQQTAGGWMR